MEVGGVGGQQLGSGVNLHELPYELFVGRLGDHEDRLVGQPYALALHGAGDHGGALAEPNLVRQQGCPVVNRAEYGVALMGPHLRLPLQRHAGEGLMRAVEDSGRVRVMGVVVEALQAFAPIRVLPDPILERLLHRLCLLLRGDGGFLVLDSLLPLLFLDLDGSALKGTYQYPVCGHLLGAPLVLHHRVGGVDLGVTRPAAAGAAHALAARNE